MNKKDWYQQGDCKCEPCAELTPEQKAGLTKLDHTTLMSGEHSGHHHIATAPDVELYAGPGGVLFMHAPHGTKVRHEEHKEIEVPAGTYAIGAVREYDHFKEEARPVID